MIKIQTSFSTLMKLASELGQAEMRNAPSEEIREAEEKLKAYEELCLKADSMSLHVCKGDLIQQGYL